MMGRAARLPLLCAGMLALAQAAPAAGLPDPPTAAPSSVTLYLELVVNTESSGQVVPVQLRDGHFYVAAGTLRELHVRTDAPPSALVAVDQIQGVGVEYDSLAQRLLLNLPADWLPSQQIGTTNRLLPDTPSTGNGVVVNYDLFASGLSEPGAAASLWTEQRFFDGNGVLSNTGVISSGLQVGAKGDYRRYDTRWTHADPDKVRMLTVGDLITSTVSWGNAARIGGVQLARNFSIRPDLVPYPLPRFSGQASVPSAVDLFINGYRAGSENVAPGPFTLNSAPFINGAGEASVVTTDALGRQVLTVVPFYVANTLLKTDTTDYAVSIGALRQNYGLENFSYGQWATSLSGRRGMTDYLTLEGRTEFSEGLALGGAGVVATLGQWGVVNLAGSFSGTSSRGDSGHGQQWNYGYQYNAQSFGIGLQQILQDPDYADLGLLGGIRSSADTFKSRSTQLNLSTSLGNIGTVSLAWFDVVGHNNQQTQIAALNYSRSIDNHNFLSVYLTNSPTSGDHSVQLLWTMVFDSQGTLSAAHNDSGKSHGNQVQYSRSPASDGGLGWNLAYANGSAQSDYTQASVIWRARQAQLQGGVYDQANRTSTWASASGSLVLMDGDLFAANRINDAFALVSTSGVPNVPVRFENQLVGETDSKGHLLVTGVNAYYPSRFEIDTLDLADFLNVPKTEQRVILPSGSGALLRFDIKAVLAANITLTDETGRPLPIGMQVEHLGNGKRAIVGWDGQVYMEGLEVDNELRVSGMNQPTCRVRFAFKAGDPGVLRVGPLVCRPQASFAFAQPQAPRALF